MIFNSLSFFIFFGLFFILYWFLGSKNYKLQNGFILIGGYVFYAWTDWRFLFFLIAVSFINFLLGIYIAKNTKNQKILLYIGLFQNLAGLFFFKYFNFFIASFNASFKMMHIDINIHLLSLIIPLGISYFTFRIMSYLLDVYRGTIPPTRDWVVFFSYVSFFPSLLSGPIDKAKHFIPQLEKTRVFDCNQASDGASQILWGLFKKMVIADNCASFANQIFDNYTHFSGSTLLLGAFFYAMQVYADFSGYSDMAIGFSKLLGFNSAKNFDLPFFSQNIAEFWRKWHMSLTSWLTDYLFTPLSIAFRDYNKLGSIIAVNINFILVGIWHGANWTYVFFGFLNGCFLIPQIVRGSGQKKKKGQLSSFVKPMKIAITFFIMMLSFVIFRSDSISSAFNFYNLLFSKSLFTLPQVIEKKNFLLTLIFIAIMLFLEFLGRKKEYAIQMNLSLAPLRSLGTYYFIIFSIMLVGAVSSNQFIYFKF